MSGLKGLKQFKCNISPPYSKIKVKFQANQSEREEAIVP